MISLPGKSDEVETDHEKKAAKKTDKSSGDNKKEASEDKDEESEEEVKRKMDAWTTIRDSLETIQWSNDCGQMMNNGNDYSWQFEV